MRWLRQLRAFVVLTLVWVVGTAMVGGLFSVILDVLLGTIGSPQRVLSGLYYWVRLGGALGLTFGAAFSVLLLVVGPRLPRGRFSTGTAALIGGIGAPVAGTALLAAVNSFFLGPSFIMGMAVAGAIVGGGVGAIAGRASLPATPEHVNALGDGPQASSSRSRGVLSE